MTHALLTSLAAIALLALVGCASTTSAPPIASSAPMPDAAREVEAMLDDISATNLRSHVDALAAFGTRHTLSDTSSPTRGVGAARNYVRDHFQRAADASGRAGELTPTVGFDTHLVEADGRRITRDVEVSNVIMTIPGALPEARGRLHYVLAHLDSRASDPNDFTSDAPGANDDASGVALLLELARIMSKRRYDATIVLVATTGEEQGLYGARRHAADLAARGAIVAAVLNNDTVGDPKGIFAPDSDQARESRRTIRVFSEGVSPRMSADEIRCITLRGAENDSPARQLARYIAQASEIHDLDVKPTLIYRNDRFLRGGDHTGFLEAGFPAAVRFTVMHEDYAKQHQDVRTEGGVEYGDLAEYVEADYLAGVTRLNAAALAHLCNAPSPPTDVRIIVADLTNDTTLRWTASPERDVAGYEVVARRTSASRWEFADDFGNVTEITVPLSKDNWLFGVRAYDSRGFRSPVAFPDIARE